MFFEAGKLGSISWMSWLGSDGDEIVILLLVMLVGM
jgi:hypothetical protein